MEQAFAKADVIVESDFRTAAQEHSPIETQASVAYTDSMGRTHIHTCTQAVFFNQGTIAGILKKPVASVHMIGGILGGGFGAKNDPHADHICAALSLYTHGRPVKWVWTREEEFVASTHRAATYLWFKDAVSRDGHILGRKIKSVRDGGAYSSTNDYVVRKAAYGVAGPYNIPNVDRRLCRLHQQAADQLDARLRAVSGIIRVGCADGAYRRGGQDRFVAPAVHQRHS